MGNAMKRAIRCISAVMLTGAFLLSAAGCGARELTENIVDDKYDNYYEVFVYSFCDSDGNGVGDFNGVTQKLSYIRDLGYTAIWLMPICVSPSYHKYDVTDYQAVDPLYGTMEDFETLVDAAHEMDIRLIIDLVVNHTSDQHPWFEQAALAAQLGRTDDPYYDYYNFSDQPLAGYAQRGSVYYEARFYSGMPDLNLDSNAVRGEISDIMRFWLEKGVDGFRLDACTSYYTGDNQKSAAFAGWLQSEAEKYNPDCYIVGEVWSNRAVIQEFYGGGADSFFYFPMSQASGSINQTLLSATPADYYFSAMEEMDATAGDSIAAPFLGNHDTGRIAGVVGRKEERVKFAYGLAGMLSGNLFTYYGDEIGMVGSATDPDKRIGMLWDNDQEFIIYPPGTTTREYEFDGVKQQLEDEGSILNYYKRCNLIRNAFPPIMRGESSRIPYEAEDVLIFSKTWNEERVFIAINFSQEERTVTRAWEGELAAALTVDGEIELRGEDLRMPGYSIAIIS